MTIFILFPDLVTVVRTRAKTLCYQYDNWMYGLNTCIANLCPA